MKRIAQNRLELALLALIAVVCAGLSILQYRWTGELGQAERARLLSGLNEQVPRLTRAFEDELSESARALLADASEIRSGVVDDAYQSRYREWASSHEPGLFTHITIAVPDHGDLRLFSLDAGGRATPIEWPADWNSLRHEMTARVNGAGPPPSSPRNSTLLEVPVFRDPEERRSSPEAAWMIFEVSEQYLRNVVLPRLVAEYLNPASDTIYDASVSWPDPGRPVVYSTRTDQSSVVRGADLTTGIFGLRISEPLGRNRRHFRDEGPPRRWTLAVRHQRGSVDAAVSSTRTRNLVTSLVLIGVLGGAAWALVRYTARSRRLAEMQFRFAAGVSHDLRTPLTAIRGAAFNIADGLISEPTAVSRYAKLILRNAEELTAMIENVLAFSASMHSAKREHGEKFAFADLVNHAAAAMEQEVEQAGCRIEVTVAPDLPEITGDRVALEHALRNLIANAARHAAQGKWIGVSAAPCDGGLEVRVSDRGPGIPQAEQQRIFEPFYRGEQARATQLRGTGLGLSLVKDTVERHRGTLTVDNSPAGGAQFTMHLPASDGA